MRNAPPTLVYPIVATLTIPYLSNGVTACRNFATLKGCCDWTPLSLPGGPSIGLAVDEDGLFDLRPVVKLRPTSGCQERAAQEQPAMATVLSVPLQSTPSLAGQLVYFAVKASLATTEQQTGVSLGLLIDRGDGKWLRSCSSVAAENHHQTVGCLRSSSSGTSTQPGWVDWSTVEFETTLLASGTARFAIEARGLCKNSTKIRVMASDKAMTGKSAAVAVAPVGVPWSAAVQS